MASQIGGMKNVKIFVLYLMKNVGYPLDFVTLNDIVMQTDYIMYLDFAEALHQMLEDGLVCRVEEESDTLYAITERGALVAESLSGDILSSVLDKCLSAAFRYLDFKKRGVVAKCTYEKNEAGGYDITCTLTEKGRDIFKTMVSVDTEDRASRMADNFREKPEVIYRGVHAMLAGNVNYLFD